MKIGKQSLEFKRIKSLLKGSKDSEIIATDDLNVIELALKYNLNIIDFYYVDDISYIESTNKIIDNAINKAKNIYTMSYLAFKALESKENQVGLIATIEYKTLQLNDIKTKDYIVVLDHLEIPGNVGTILRTLDSADVDALIVVDPITKMHNPKITTSSRGCNLLIPTVVCSYEEAQKWLLENNYDIYLGEPNLGLDYKSYNYDHKLAIVVGNERFGINEKWYDNNHKKVYIPMYGSNNSLNVGVAASILVYEATMKRKSGTK